MRPRRSAQRQNVPPEGAAPDLAALILAAAGTAPGANERIAIATSGGPDSIGLLALAAHCFPGRITALTVDHGLRAASAAEAALVARQCAARGITHATLRWEGPKPKANLQALARAARYRLMGGWCRAHGVAWLLTAHHADDQAETLLMRLARGSGSGGLAGIRAARDMDGVRLVRPLLGLRKADLARLAAGWEFVADPANADPRHDRTHARALIEATPWLDAPALAAAAAHLADDAAALDWAADRAWEGNVRAEAGAVLIDAAGLPAAILHRLLARAIAALAPDASLRGGDIARLAARIGAGQVATLAGVKVRPGPVWRLELTPKPQESRQLAVKARQNRTG